MISVLKLVGGVLLLILGTLLLGATYVILTSELPFPESLSDTSTYPEWMPDIVRTSIRLLFAWSFSTI